MNPIVSVSNLGKCYPIYSHPLRRIQSMLGLGNPRHRQLWALREVNFNILHGESFGIIGPNGAGKSTLLKLITGISRPTEGGISIHGSVASILELGIGFHPDFTGRSNVYLNCALYGFTREETDRLLPEIIEFSELDDFIDLPVRMYSTGMALRLAFSVATSVDPDVLIVDEALAVGDEHFRNKCLDRMNQFKALGKTILLVSHDLATVRNFCSRVALLDRGTLLACGKPDEVLDQYLEMAHRTKLPKAVPSTSSTPRWGSAEIKIDRAVLRNEQGNEQQMYDTNETVLFDLEFTVNQPINGAVFGCLIHRADGTYVHGSNHHWHKNATVLQFDRPGERHVIRCVFPALPLLPGQYYISACCYNHNQPFPQPIDHWERACIFSISERMTDQHGILAMETEWRMME